MKEKLSTKKLIVLITLILLIFALFCSFLLYNFYPAEEKNSAQVSKLNISTSTLDKYLNAEFNLDDYFDEGEYPIGENSLLRLPHYMVATGTSIFDPEAPLCDYSISQIDDLMIPFYNPLFTFNFESMPDDSVWFFYDSMPDYIYFSDIFFTDMDDIISEALSEEMDNSTGVLSKLKDVDFEIDVHFMTSLKVANHNSFVLDVSYNKYNAYYFEYFSYDILWNETQLETVLTTSSGGDYDSIYDQAYQDGHDDGFIHGAEWKNEQILNDKLLTEEFIFDIFEAPFKVLGHIFNFEIFGINVSSVVFFLISTGIVFFVIKRLL